MEYVSENRQNLRAGEELGRTKRKTCDRRSNVRNSFLTHKFESIPGHALRRIEADLSIAPSDDMERLRGIVSDYLHSQGTESALPQVTGNYQYDLGVLLRHLKNNLPEGVDVDIVKTTTRENPDDRIEFVVYRILDFPEDTVFYIPISILSSLENKDDKELLELFFCMLWQKDMFQLPEDSYDMQYALGQLDNCFEGGKFDEYTEDNWSEDYLEIARSYCYGEISKYFQSIKSQKERELNGEGMLSQIVLNKLNEVHKSGKSSLDGELLNLMYDGISLCNESWLTDYTMTDAKLVFGEDFADDQDTSELMDFVRIFMFCWKEDDMIAEHVIDILNNDCQCMNQQQIINYSILGDPDIEKRMSDDFPVRWSKWVLKLINKLNK